MLIGGLWISQELEAQVRDSIREVRAQHNLRAEMKWTKVSETMLAAYKDFVDVFFKADALAFKCIVVDTRLLDYKAFHKGDKELGFYKFYFQLISRNLFPQNLYWLYTDERKNRKSSRLATLIVTVNRWCMKNKKVAPLRLIEPRRSHNEDFIQLADILLGAIAYVWNGQTGSRAKLALVEHIARRINYSTLKFATRPTAKKMNVWKWEPKVKRDAP